jgi:hypothetical protein
LENLIQYQEMREAIARVRKLHLNPRWDVCPTCFYWDETQREYVGFLNPCPTIKALDGEQ